MGLHLTTEDVAKLEAASRAMLSPLSAASVDDWRRSVSRSVRELFVADKTIFMLPKGSHLFFSDEDAALAAGVESYITAYTTEGIYLSDVVVDLWNQLRRKERLEVFTWALNESMIGRHGYRMRDSEMVDCVLGSHDVRDFTGCYVDIPQGEVLLWMLFDRPNHHRFGESSTALLRALLPSLKAGLDTLVRHDLHRLAIDESVDPIAVFAHGNREVYRNNALLAAYNADPESDRINSEIRQMAGGLCALGFATHGKHAESAQSPALRSIKTNRGQYDLKGTFLPPGVFDADSTVMITLVFRGAIELPSSDELRERYGITVRESEIAVLLAKGYANDQIADSLSLSPHTIRRHTANIFGKIEVNSRKALALKFLSE